MKFPQFLARPDVPRRLVWLVCALAIALAPLTLTGQAPPAKPAAVQPVTAQPATTQVPAAKPAAPLSWADKMMQQETYATPPTELAEAVTAPRHQNVTLSNLSPDKKWFLNLIGDGPVPMSIFSKPFDELGGVFIDFKANRVRSADHQQQRRRSRSSPPRMAPGSRLPSRPTRASRTPLGRRTVAGWPISCTPTMRRTSGSPTWPPTSRARSRPSGAGHAGQQLRLHEGRPADRGRADSRRPRGRCRRPHRLPPVRR